MKYPSIFAAQIEQESCIHLKHAKCWNTKSERVDARLHATWFGMRSDEDEQTIQFQLPYGDWVRLSETWPSPSRPWATTP